MSETQGLDALGIPDADKLRDLLAAEGGADVALVEPNQGDPFYVGLNGDGELVRIERT